MTIRLVIAMVTCKWNAELLLAYWWSKIITKENGVKSRIKLNNAQKNYFCKNKRTFFVIFYFTAKPFDLKQIAINSKMYFKNWKTVNFPSV